MRRVYLAAFLILLTVMSNLAFSDEMHVITLRQFLSETVSDNPEIYAALTKIRDAESLQTQSRALYNLYLDTSYYHQYQHPQDVTSSNFGIVEQYGDMFDMNVSGAIPALGSRYRAGIQIGQTYIQGYLPDISTIEMSGTNIVLDNMGYILTNVEMYQPSWYFEFQQPLLKNWMGILDRFPLRQTDLNREITEISVNETIETIIIDLYKVYFDWYVAYHSREIFAESVSNSESLIGQIRQKLAYNLVERSDLDQVLIMNIEYKKARDQLSVNVDIMLKKIYYWMTDEIELPTGIEFIPENEILLPEIPVGDHSPFDTRQIAMLKLAKQLLLYELEKIRNDMMPELNLMFQYSFGNSTDNPYHAYDLSDFNGNYTIGLEFSYPFGESAGRGAMEATKAKLIKWENDVTTFERYYRQGLLDLEKMMKVYANILNYDKELIRLSESIVREEENKYLQGRSDLYFIIQDKDKLVQYKLTYLKDYVEYQKICLQYLGLIDRIYPQE